MPVKYPYLLFLDGFLFCCFFSRLLLLLLDIPPSAEPLLVCTVKLRPSVRRWRFCAQHHRHHQDGEVEEGRRRRRRRRGKREHQPAAASASGCGSNSHRSNNTHAPFFFSFSFFLSFFFFFTRAGTQEGRQSARSAAPKSPQLVWHTHKKKNFQMCWCEHTQRLTDWLTDCDKWSLPAAPQPRVLKVQ